MALHAIGAHNSSYCPFSRSDVAAAMLGGGKGCSDADSILFESLRLACTGDFPARSLREEKTFERPGAATDSGGQLDSGGLRSSVPDLPRGFKDIQAALFPPEVGQPCVVPQQPVAAVGAAAVSAYAPPMAGAVGRGASAPVRAAAKPAVKTYAPASVGGVGAASPWAPQGTRKEVSVANAALNVVKCRPYWPAYSEVGHPLSAAAGSLPIIRPSAAGPRPRPLPYTAAAHAPPAPSALPLPLAAESDGKSWDADVPPKPATAADAASASWGGSYVASSHSSARLKGRERSTSEGSEGADKLTFLVEMFNKTEAALVADVFRACNGDHDAAMQSLMDMQSNAKTSTSQGSSCSASDRDDGGGGQWAPIGGEWDVSGTPNDYTFTDLTLEQKALALRKAHPAYQAAEVEAALLAHGGDVNATAAALVLGADARAEERAREQDRQFAEKLAHEINSAGSPDAVQGNSGPAKGGSHPAQGAEARTAASAQARLRLVFPDADADVLLSTLLVANSNFESARKMLRASGLKEAPAAKAPRPQPRPLPPPPPPPQMAASVVPLAAPAALPACGAGPRRAWGTFQQSPAAAESSRVKQQIFEEEMKVSGAEAASARYRSLVAQASQAHGARDYAAAAALREQAHEERDRQHKLAKEARHRIRKRTNKLLINEYKVDLHGLDAAQAVDALHDTLAKFAGEHSTMRLVFITGQGLHSANGQSVLRPALLAAVASLRLEHEVLPGAVNVYVRPDADAKA